MIKFNPLTQNFDLVNPATDITGKANLALDNLASVAMNAPLQWNNSAAQTFDIAPTANTVVGRALTVSAGSTITGGTADMAGGNLTLNSGLGKGTGASSIIFQTGTTLATGATLQTLSTKMTILGNGNVGIGTTNPTEKLMVSGNVSALTDSTSNLGTSSIYWANTYTDKIYLNATATLDGATGGMINVTATSFNLGTTSTTFKPVNFYQNLNADMYFKMQNAYSGKGCYQYLQANSNYVSTLLQGTAGMWAFGMFGGAGEFLIKRSIVEDVYDVIASFAINGVADGFVLNSSANLLLKGGLTLNATSIVTDTTTGLKIGTGTTQKLGFFNTTPAVQPAHIADPTGGAVVDAEARTAINSINALLATLGLSAAA